MMARMYARKLAAGWTPPANCIQWLAYAKSGAVAAATPGGVWYDASGVHSDVQLTNTSYVDANGLYLSTQPASLVGSGSGFANSTWSICGWIKVAQRTFNPRIVAFEKTSYQANGYTINIGSGFPDQWAVGTQTAAGAPVAASSSHEEGNANWVNKWRWIGAVKTATTLKVWRDGTSYEVACTATPTWTSCVYKLGGLGSECRIDDVQVYSRNLTDAEMDSIRTGSPGKRG